MATVSAGEAIGAGTRTVGPALRQAPAAMGLLALAFVLTSLAPNAEAPVNSLLLLLIRIPFVALATAAVLRLALGRAAAGDSGPMGPGGLQWGPMEWRVVAVQGLLLLVYAALFVVMILMVGIILGILMSSGVVPTITPPTGAMTPQAALALFTGPVGVALILLCLPVLAVFVYVSLKLALAVTSSAADGQIKLFRAWGLTRGVLWPVFAVSFVSGLISVAGGFMGGFIGGIVRAALGPMAEAVPQALGAGVGTLLSLPVEIGGLAFIYLATTGGPRRVEEVFR